MSSLVRQPGYPSIEWLKKQLTVDEAEREQQEEARELQIDSISSRWLEQWNEFKAILQPDDQLWYFEHFPEPFSGTAGYCIVRDDSSIASITTKRA